MKMLGGPFDGRDFPEAKGHTFLIPCRSFRSRGDASSPVGVEPGHVETVAVYYLSVDDYRPDGGLYHFQREEVVPDGYLAPTPAATRSK